MSLARANALRDLSGRRIVQSIVRFLSRFDGLHDLRGRNLEQSGCLRQTFDSAARLDPTHPRAPRNSRVLGSRVVNWTFCSTRGRVVDWVLREIGGDVAELLGGAGDDGSKGSSAVLHGPRVHSAGTRQWRCWQVDKDNRTQLGAAGRQRQPCDLQAQEELPILPQRHRCRPVGAEVEVRVYAAEIWWSRLMG